MTTVPGTHSKLTFFLDSKLHEDLKIRLYYDQVKSQSDFFRMCTESYLSQNELFACFFDDYKINNQIQSRHRTKKSRKLREKGSRLMEEMALTETDVENIFDILEEELPEL